MEQFSSEPFLLKLQKNYYHHLWQMCLWYSTPKIFSFSVKKESVNFYSTDPRHPYVNVGPLKTQQWLELFGQINWL